MGGILNAAGISGILENRRSDRPDQDDHDTWCAICQKMAERFGYHPVSAGEILQVILEVNPDSDLADPYSRNSTG